MVPQIQYLQSRESHSFYVTPNHHAIASFFSHIFAGFLLGFFHTLAVVLLCSYLAPA